MKAPLYAVGGLVLKLERLARGVAGEEVKGAFLKLGHCLVMGASAGELLRERLVKGAEERDALVHATGRDTRGQGKIAHAEVWFVRILEHPERIVLCADKAREEARL